MEDPRSSLISTSSVDIKPCQKDRNCARKSPKARLLAIITDAPDLGLFPNDLPTLFDSHLKEGRIEDAYVAIVQYLKSMKDLYPNAAERYMAVAQNVQNRLLKQFWEQNRKWILDQQRSMDTFQWQKLHNDLILEYRNEKSPNPLEEIEDCVWNDVKRTSTPKMTGPALAELECLLADPSVMPFAKLQEILDNSQNPEVLERCRSELKRRKEITEQWEKKKIGSYSKALLTRSNSRRFSSSHNVLVRHNERRSSSTFYDSELEPVVKELHRFFHSIKVHNSDSSFKRFLYYHFRGENMVRCLEVTRTKPALLLIEGDSGIPKKTLTEIGLPLKRGAEISKEKFELVWQKYGGRPWLYNENS